MSYTIKDIAKMMNVSTYTLRYYDKEGLFPNVKRVNGIRIFEEKDFEWLRVLNCLKNINMPIKKIKEYIDLCELGDASLEKRLGAVIAGNDGRRGYIYHLAVNPKYRKRGIGTQLVKNVMKSLEELGINKVALLVFKRNDGANAFWEKQGFSLREDINYRNKEIKELVRIDT